MKKNIQEPDFIGGIGPLTKEQEALITSYLLKSKAVKSKALSPVDEVQRSKNAKGKYAA